MRQIILFQKYSFKNVYLQMHAIIIYKTVTKQPMVVKWGDFTYLGHVTDLTML